jgi:hypothetical protein
MIPPVAAVAAIVVGRVGFGSLELDDGRGEAAFWVLPDARARTPSGRLA